MASMVTQAYGRSLVRKIGEARARHVDIAMLCPSPGPCAVRLECSRRKPQHRKHNERRYARTVPRRVVTTTYTFAYAERS